MARNTMTDLLRTETVLNKQAVAGLAKQLGPCLTLFLPAYLPGGSQASYEATAKAALKGAENLDGEGFAQLKASLLQSIEESADKGRAGGPGLAIFCAPGFQSSYIVPDVHQQVVAGSHFHLVPLITQADVSQDLFVLTLSTKRLRLFHYNGKHCELRAFPEGVPDNLEEAGGFNRSESGLSNRKSVGASGSSAGGVHFGTISQPKTDDAYIHDFFETVDRGLQDILEGRPLLLLGVHEEVTTYHRASVNPHVLLDGPAGNADFLPPDQIATLARKAALDDYHRRGRAVLAQYREMSDRHRASHDIQEVLRAGGEGRIHELCIRESASIVGKLPNVMDRAHLAGEDLVNAAAIETLRAGGQVWVLPGEEMPAAEPVVAILRY
jgi:hypothetical protein